MPTDLADELELVVTGGVNDVRYIEFIPDMFVSNDPLVFLLLTGSGIMRKSTLSNTRMRSLELAAPLITTITKLSSSRRWLQQQQSEHSLSESAA